MPDRRRRCPVGLAIAVLVVRPDNVHHQIDELKRETVPALTRHRLQHRVSAVGGQFRAQIVVQRMLVLDLQGPGVRNKSY